MDSAFVDNRTQGIIIISLQCNLYYILIFISLQYQSLLYIGLYLTPVSTFIVYRSLSHSSVSLYCILVFISFQCQSLLYIDLYLTPVSIFIVHRSLTASHSLIYCSSKGIQRFLKFSKFSPSRLFNLLH